MRTALLSILLAVLIGTGANGAGIPYADRICPETNAKGGVLLELLAIKPVQPAEKIVAVTDDLATLYEACSASFRTNGMVENGNYGSLQYAKMRLIAGTFLIRLEKTDEARMAFADAEKRAGEVAASVGRHNAPTLYRADAEDVRGKAHAAIEALTAK